MIDTPKLPKHHPDRELECEESIEGELAELIERAEGAGWNYVEVSSAIISLTHYYCQKRDSIEQTERVIAREKRRLQ